MSLLLAARFVHLIAASTWVGGMIVLAPIVLSLRRAGAERALVQAAARTFARVTWVALAIAVATGLLQAHLLGWLYVDYRPLHVKMLAVALTIVVALIHQRTAAQASPAIRGALELSLLLSSLLVVAAAVAL